MKIPSAVLENPRDLPYWDTSSVHNLLGKLGQSHTLRSTERLLAKAHWLPPALRLADLRDERGRELIHLVAASIDAQSKKKRVHSRYVQANVLADGRYIIIANDGRGARRWLFVDQLGVTQLVAALDALCDGKSAYLWPHGAITEHFRTLQAAQGTSRITLPSNNKVTIALFAYRSAVAQMRDPQRQPRAEDRLQHLDDLEAQGIHIMREVVAQADKPVMLYSMGKDSSVLLHLARKSFFPNPPPFPLLHVDTLWKFQAMYDFREQIAELTGMDLIVHVNPEGIAKNINPFDHGSSLHTDVMKTQALNQALHQHGFDFAVGGARRDEQRIRAKERVFSYRNDANCWDPQSQRPELWNIYNGYKNPGESIRVFPLSNWTELDVWQYIQREQIPIVPLYFADERPVIVREGTIVMVDDDRMRLLPGEQVESRRIRFRSLGCYPLTGAVESSADSVPSIVLEILHSRTSERQGRAIDTDSADSMEKKKQQGYF